MADWLYGSGGTRGWDSRPLQWEEDMERNPLVCRKSLDSCPATPPGGFEVTPILDQQPAAGETGLTTGNLGRPKPKKRFARGAQPPRRVDTHKGPGGTWRDQAGVWGGVGACSAVHLRCTARMQMSFRLITSTVNLLRYICPPHASHVHVNPVYKSTFRVSYLSWRSPAMFRWQCSEGYKDKLIKHNSCFVANSSTYLAECRIGAHDERLS